MHSCTPKKLVMATNLRSRLSECFNGKDSLIMSTVCITAIGRWTADIKRRQALAGYAAKCTKIDKKMFSGIPNALEVA